jgi:hypothetical protein
MRGVLCGVMGGALTLSGCLGLGERFAQEELWLAEPVGWEEVAPIFEARCAVCHADPPLGGATFPLRSYDEVAPWVERVRARVIVAQDMPPGGLRDLNERDLIARWLAVGAPAPAEPVGGAAVAPPTWEGDIKPLFDLYCNNCHAPVPTGGAPFPLTTYAEAAPWIDRFEVRVLERMDMPPGGVRDADDLALIESWVRAGAPER